MHSNFAFARVQAIPRNGLAVLFAVLLGSSLLWAHPEKGTPAPPLDSLTLLQAPAGAKADWAGLKGKVVVLEFWATWCSPCVASLPHLNQLVESLDPARFQFISIDDEDLKAVQTFLTKKKMAGWVGVDSTGGIMAWYGIKSRPTSIIIDGNGRIVAATEIESVSAADLQAVAEGKSVTFMPVSETISSDRSTAMDAATLPLFAVSFSKAAPDAKASRINHPPTGSDSLAVDADGLLTDYFEAFHERYFLNGKLPDERYDLRMNFVDVPNSTITSVIQQAILSGLRLQVESKTFNKPAYILRATGASKNLLSPSASTRKVKRGYWHGIYILMNGTMDDLAWILATGLENPVINQTGIDGAFDARFKVDGEGVDSLNAVLRKSLGLELVPGTQEMSITVQEVSSKVESKPTPEAQESAH
jgi:thiol-disulfide isomerase/thioredoxin